MQDNILLTIEAGEFDRIDIALKLTESFKLFYKFLIIYKTLKNSDPEYK